MGDAFVQVLPDSTGKKVDTSELTVGAATVERQRIVVADPSAAAALGAVTAAAPAGNAYGLVTRPLAYNYVLRVDENPGDLTVSGNATFTGATHDLGDLSSGGPGFARWRVFVYADQPGTLNMCQSEDGATWYATQSQPVTALQPLIVESMVTLRYLQAQFANGVNADGVFVFWSALVAV